MRTKTYTGWDFVDVMKGAEALGDSFDKLNDLVVITDDDGVILFANKVAAETTGYEQDELIGKTPGDLWGNHMSKDFYAKMWRTIKIEKKPFSGIVENTRKDGTKYYAELRIYPILDPSGRISFFVGIEPDVTSKMAEQRSKEEILSLAAHQLQSPFAASRLLLHCLLKKGMKLTPQQKELIKKIQEVNNYSQEFVQDLLMFFRRDVQTKVAFEKHPVSLADLIGDIIRRISTSAQEKKISLEFRYAKDEIVDASPTALRHILENVLSNAVKYSFANQTVAVSFVRKGREVMVSCKDSGVGMPQKEQDKVFTPFFRASNVAESKDGTGLGLFLAKKLAEDFGYRMWFVSQEGGGTIFYLAIPLPGQSHKISK